MYAISSATFSSSHKLSLLSTHLCGPKFSRVLEITFLDQTNENSTEPELLYEMFIAVSFVITSSWKQPRSILTDITH